MSNQTPANSQLLVRDLKDYFEKKKDKDNDSNNLSLNKPGSLSQNTTTQTQSNSTFTKRSICKENETIISVWFSEGAGGANIGHAALTIPKYELHASLWPEIMNTDFTTLKAITGRPYKPLFLSIYYNPAKPNEVPDIQTSIDGHHFEGRRPEFTCHLYSLDTDAIKVQYEELRRTISDWRIVDKKTNDGVFAMSCAGLVRELLLSSNINKLAKPRPLTTYAPTPHNIFTWARDAKIRELALYPRTAQLDVVPFNARADINNWAMVQEVPHYINKIFESLTVKLPQFRFRSTPNFFINKSSVPAAAVSPSGSQNNVDILREDNDQTNPSSRQSVKR